jgi:PPOX class probable F420-dependent enzyme
VVGDAVGRHLDRPQEDSLTATIPPQAHALLDEPNFGHLTTLMADGSPQVSPVWVDRDGDAVLVNTSKGRVKHRNIERDPRVAISIADTENPYVYIQVRGRAEVTDEDGLAHINALSHKYMGRDYPFLKEGEERVVVRITPDSVDFQHRA